MLTKVTTSPSNLFHRVRLKETASVLLGGSGSIMIGLVVFQPFVAQILVFVSLWPPVLPNYYPSSLLTPNISFHCPAQALRLQSTHVAMCHRIQKWLNCRERASLVEFVFKYVEDQFPSTIAARHWKPQGKLTQHFVGFLLATSPITSNISTKILFTFPLSWLLSLC